MPKKNKPKESPPYTIDNAVRDICKVSVTAAPKGAVKRILEKLCAQEFHEGTVHGAEYIVEALKNDLKPCPPIAHDEGCLCEEVADDLLFEAQVRLKELRE